MLARKQAHADKTPAKGRPFNELRYKDPATGLDVKRRVRGLEPAEIKEIARELNIKAQIGKGHLASQPQAPGIEDGLIEAISLTYTTDGVKRERIRLALAPVKLAWRVMHENWPELVRPMPRIKLGVQGSSPCPPTNPSKAISVIDPLCAIFVASPRS